MTSKHRRKFVAFFCVVILMLLCHFGMGAYAQGNEEEFIVSDGMLVSYNGTNSVVKVPEMVDGVTIQGIGPYAFAQNEMITEVTIPESVTIIGRNAFHSCVNLERVSLPSSLKNIDAWAFGYCELLHEISLPDGIQTLDSAAFYGCSSLKRISIPESVTRLGTHCFRGCVAMEQAEVLAQIDVLPYRLFSGCDALKTFTISDSVTTIDRECFYNSGITNLIFGENVQHVNSGAFAYCRYLDTIEFNNKVTDIGAEVFIGCSSLTYLDLPENVQIIGDSAFEGCVSLTEAYLNGVLYIHEAAFEDCYALRIVQLSARIQDIGNEAFKGCHSLFLVGNASDLDIRVGSSAYGGVAEFASFVCTDVEEAQYTVLEDNGGQFFFIDGETGPVLVRYVGKDGSCYLPSNYHGNRYDIGSCAFSNNADISFVIIPDGIETIGERAFANCTSLWTVSIPKTVLSIGISAFEGCDNIRSVIYKGTEAEWACMSIEDGNEAIIDRIPIFDHSVAQESSGLSSVKNELNNLFAGNIFFINFVLTLVWGIVFLVPSSARLTEREKKKRKKRFVIVCCVQWILISGLRADSVGSDTINYMNLFDRHIHMDLKTILRSIKGYYLSGTFSTSLEYEPGYILLERLIGLFTTSHTAYKFIIAIIFTSALGYFIYNNSDDPCLSFIIYDGLLYNMFSLTGYRQTVSVAIGILLGYQFIKKRNPWKFIITVLIAALFHKTTLVFLLFYLLANKRITKKYVTFVCVVSFVMIIFRKQLFNYVKVIAGYELYSGGYGFAQGTFTFLLGVMTIVALVLYHQIAQNSPYVLHYYNGLIMMWITMPFAMVDPSAMRLVYDFGFMLLLFVPALSTSFQKPSNRYIVNFVIIVLFGFFIFTRSPVYSFA